MEGISSIIVVLLILLITLALAAGLALFLTSTSGALQNATETQTSQAVQALGQDFSIEAVRGGDIYIRNKGSVKLSGLSLYVDDVPLNTTKPEIPPGTVGVIHSYDFIDYSRGERTLTVKSSVLTRKTKIGPENQYPELVAYWKFDEGSGTIAYDSSLYGNNGTLSKWATAPLPEWVQGKYNWALKFNATGPDYGGYIKTNNQMTLSTPLTFSAWIKPSSTGNYPQIINTKCDGSGYVGFAFSLGYYTYQLGLGTTSKELWTGSVVDNTGWYLVVGVINGSYSAIYVNGMQKANVALEDLSATDYTFIGAGRYYDCAHPDKFFNGTIDDVRIWSRALTPEEIWNQYIHGPI
jgi:FlaG/FlaF family flagellin (archaellin)